MFEEGARLVAQKLFNLTKRRVRALEFGNHFLQSSSVESDLGIGLLERDYNYNNSLKSLASDWSFLSFLRETRVYLLVVCARLRVKARLVRAFIPAPLGFHPVGVACL